MTANRIPTLSGDGQRKQPSPKHLQPEVVDPLEAVIRPIVEGQLRAFVNAHPSILVGVDWYKPREDKKTTFVNSVSKRIVRDLLCLDNRIRLVTALVDPRSAQAV